MKLLVVAALLCFVLSKAENCAQKKSYKCVKDLNIYYNEHITEEEQCRELVDVNNCFKSALEECVNEEADELIQEIIKILDIHLKEKCYEVLSEAENCARRKSNKCVKDLNIYYNEHITEEEHCRELFNVNNCFNSALAECVNDEPDEGIKEIIKGLDIHLKEKCYEVNVGNEVEEKNNPIKQCVDDNALYISDCIDESTTKILTVIIESNEQSSHNALECIMYLEVAKCFVERIGEKCGEDAEDAARKEMEDVPLEIVESCISANLA